LSLGNCAKKYVDFVVCIVYIVCIVFTFAPPHALYSKKKKIKKGRGMGGTYTQTSQTIETL